jgi:hypothetical protein
MMIVAFNLDQRSFNLDQRSFNLDDCSFIGATDLYFKGL